MTRETVLVEALEKHGTKKMAEDFLNCENRRLEEAARRWGEMHGYPVILAHGRVALHWGTMPQLSL
jgi:hypothetical protein